MNPPSPIRLCARLAAAAEFVRPGARVADVGTDHGYLICALVESGCAVGGVACDLRPGPLAGARALIQARGLEGQIDSRLCDGLDGVSPGEADDIVLAGMGGELIAAIVGRAAWLRDPEKRLILQPQTRAPALRRALYGMGFAILRERGVRDGRFLYTVLSCAFTGEARDPGELICHVGALPEDGRPESREYLLHLAAQLRRRADGLASSTNRTESESIYQLANEIIQLIGKGETSDEGEGTL